MSLTDFLQPEAITIQLTVENAEDVIRHLGGKLHALGYVKDDFVEATLAREAELPTGLPLAGSINAAIPHVDIEYVHQPALALATLSEPVIFQNMVDIEEDVPCRLIIMLALDQPKSQIEMLQQVAGVLQSPELVDRLMEAENVEEILVALSGESVGT